MSTLAKAKSPFGSPRALPTTDALLERLDFLRLDASRRLDPKRRAKMGQFMTPPSIARLMASMFENHGRSLRLLDAGAGVGSLSAAWVAMICSLEDPVEEISITAYEVDEALLESLKITMDACLEHCKRVGVRFQSDVRQEDFIAAGTRALRGGLFESPPDVFDCAILNPPYRKINTDSKERRLIEALGVETTNLYAAFLSVVMGLLKPGGELVAITPRSFCNGPYFRSFRKRFFEQMRLRHIHCFEARDRAFSDDEVLQENVIFHALKAPAEQRKVSITSSTGPEDECPTWRQVDIDQVLKPRDPDRFIHIPVDALSEHIEERMEQFRTPLMELGVEVSTGRVVDFRSSEYLRAEPGPDTVPLIYPSHIFGGLVRWPRNGKKPNALAVRPETQELILPRGYYVVVKRFSAKEERRRVVAALYDPNRYPAMDVAFENHLNYFHARGRPLSPNLAKGLVVFLNSTLVDCYFREWSGHTQVNATDLRRFKYPSRVQLDDLGSRVVESFPSQDKLDRYFQEKLLKVAKFKGLPDPVRAKSRIQEAVAILKDLGLPREQQNDRSGLTLLALLGLRPNTSWSKASNPLRGITQMMTFFAEHYGKTYKPNTRETVRRFTVHQFVQAGLAIQNPDKPDRPTNSPQAVYQIEASALSLLKTFGSRAWESRLRKYLASIETLKRRYAQEREMERIPLRLMPGSTITLSPGGQNVLVKEIIEEFCPRFTPGAKPVYVGDTQEKWAYFDKEQLLELRVAVDAHGKMPDVVVFDESKSWLVLIEAVTSHGPVNPKRHHELKRLFKSSKAGLVFVTAFQTRRDLMKYLNEIAWETEVWVAESPGHMIHFNGERFLGPF